MTAAGLRYLTVGEAQPFQAIASVDWSRMPALVKRYPPAGARPVPPELGTLLREAYGFTRLQWDNWHSLPGQRGRAELTRGRPLRPVPSGGGLFPAELYLVGEVPGLPGGAYHYDPAADRLDTVRVRATLPGAPGAWHLVITAVLSRTTFKYGEFGYRLACLDGGALAGQLLGLAETAGRPTTVVNDLDDDEVAAALGLDQDAEPVVAVLAVAPGRAGRLPESRDPQPLPATRPVLDDPAEAWAAPTPRTEPRRDTARIPLATALARDSRRPSRAGAAPATPTSAEPVAASTERVAASAEPVAAAGEPVLLPPTPDLVLTDHARARRSLDGRFGSAPVTLDQLAAVLRAGARHPHASGISLACVAHRVAGLPAGRYRYAPSAAGLETAAHAAGAGPETAAHDAAVADLLRPAGREGDLRSALAPAPGQAPLVGDHGGGVSIFVLGDYLAGFALAGSRWYRTLNVAAGIAAQRMALAATALGLGQRIVCAYDTARVVATLGLEPGTARPLCQVIVGPVAATTVYSQPMEAS